MTVRRDTGLQFALVNEILDVNARKRQVEEKIRAAEERNKLLLENAARRDIDDHIKSKMHNATKAKPSMSLSQLSLHFENIGTSASIESVAPLCEQAGQLEPPRILRVAP